MYKLLLCLRYLQTRYLAFICIVSVMLGVSTLIVVNAVMSGFSTKLKDRLHGVLSDVIIDTDRMEGFPDAPDRMIAKIKASPAGDRIEAITPTVEVFAIFQFQFRDQTITKPVKLIGIDPAGRASVGGFSEYLVNNSETPHKAFDLTPQALQKHLSNKSWAEAIEKQKKRDNVNVFEVPEIRIVPPPKPLIPDPMILPQIGPAQVDPAFIPPIGGPLTPEQRRAMQPVQAFTNPNTRPHAQMDIGLGTPEERLFGVVPGYTLAHFRYRNDQGVVVEEAALEPGDSVTITTVGGNDLKPVWGNFLVTDYLRTEMSEYDQSFVYVPLDQLQRLRGMNDRATALQIKLKNYDKDRDFVVNEIRKIYPFADIRIASWEEHQGPLLSAIEVERGILNLLLFMIVGVAGFSILAIFTMIVSEKFRDIGILKALGASNAGVMKIFLGYGLLLGTVGCALGTAAGLWITYKINEIEAFLTKITGHAVFPRDVYYFKEIPTNVDPLSVVVVNLGAISIAVVFSLLPAFRAARLHPVRALRFE